MDHPVVRTERRGRKRKNVQNGSAEEQLKKQAVETRSKAYVGRYVRKEFEGSGFFLGKIVFYGKGLYRVDYEDGDCEDLEAKELRQFIVSDDAFDEVLMVKKRKLDEFLSSKALRVEHVQVAEPVNTAGGVEVVSLNELSSGYGNEDEGTQLDGDTDSSSDSCEYVQNQALDPEVGTPLVPPPELPPSSGNVGISEEYVSHLFSVYSFLRSFSIRLFLSPFELDDFVGSLNCSFPNILFDAIHVALMRALRRYFEKLSSDGSEIAASKCLRCLDWSLLDSLTWPVYLVQYLTIMGYTEGSEWKGFYTYVLQRDYYALPADRKLVVLQILCDDVLECEEMRAEIDIREELEVGIEYDEGTEIALEGGPRRVHPRFAKTSACKDQEVIEIIADCNKAKSSPYSGPLKLEGIGLDTNIDANQDDNGDECRLCGMDGTLLCCDGCPSAYHSRCIGLNKVYIPDGAWYCPECTINKAGPTITKGTSLRGADIFGFDSYGHIFLGTCNHLLVLKVPISSESCLRYYNKSDIPHVLRTLCSSLQHVAIYLRICKGILQYWGIPENVISLTEAVEMGTKLVHEKEAEGCSVPLVTSLGIEMQNVVAIAGAEKNFSCVTENSQDDISVALLEKEHLLNQRAFGTMAQSDSPNQYCGSNGTMEHDFPITTNNHPEHIRASSAMVAGFVGQQVSASESSQYSLVGKHPLESTCSSGNANSSYGGPVDGMCVSGNMSYPCKEVNSWVDGSGYSNLVNNCSYTGSSFKSHAYINNYAHGDFAASAAANLAVLSSEENQVSEFHSSENRRKIVSANISLQLKAFSSAAVRFFWPHSERKIVEVPRERCGWCFSCKAPVASKRGCLLNLAASNAVKGAMKILAGLRPVKHGEGSLTGIATYIMLMEESLYGLTIGPFQNSAYRKKWRMHVEQATDCNAVKTLLLGFEENIRCVALSGDWFKLVDSWLLELPVHQSATNAVPSVQKRGPGRRGRKPSTMPEITSDDCQDVLTDFTWWRGGMVSKVLLQKGTLPWRMVTKAARQGGSRKIHGICYSDGLEIPKRSRQCVWRAAVEMSKTTSQLALQVRYLDLHLRWSDLVRPEQCLQDGKGPETEASAFRNAFICDKKIVESKIRYSVAFGNQKHLPSRVMKNIIEVEENQDGKEKYWFLETRIPLYLIKEYEENTGKRSLSFADKALDASFKLQRRQLKACQPNIFSYLFRKCNNLHIGCCASCQSDVLLRNAIKCTACQGFCHEQCIASSTTNAKEEVEFLFSCKQCSHNKALNQNENSRIKKNQNENSNESPTSPLLLQVQEFQKTPVLNKGGKQIGHHGPSVAVGILDRSSKIDPATKDSSLSEKKQRKLSWGLIWKKKNDKDTGLEFRSRNILVKDNPNLQSSGPVCHLCDQPYNSNLMYIHCETCTNWYHADAVELEESKIFDLVGFKCCRCRRIRIPKCPYLDPNSEKGKMWARKEANSVTVSISKATSKNIKEVKSPVPVIPKKAACVQEENPSTTSFSRNEQFKEPLTETDSDRDIAKFGAAPQKLPVRRHMKRDNDMGASVTDNSSHTHSPSPHEGTNLESADESSQVGWDVSMNDVDENLMFDCDTLDYEDMEFEPQTYFSFTELLAPDDGGQLDAVEPSEDGTVIVGQQSSVVPRDGSSDLHGFGTGDQQEPATSEEPAFDMVPCRKCSSTEPCPDLSCQICGLWMHSHCSPWSEDSSCNGGWRCGNCREWR